MTLNSRGYRGACDQRPIVIKRDPLVCDRDDDLERAIRSILGLIFLRRFGLGVPLPVAVPRRSMIARPISPLRPKQESGVGGPCGHGANGKCRQYCRAD